MRATHDVYEFLHFSHTLGANLAHLQGYERTELVSLHVPPIRQCIEVNAMCNAPSQQVLRVFGVVFHPSGEPART